jgi:hypothetical protein
VSWSIAGTYLEACNCEAICPCRRIGGVAGGRSTSGICEGALSWAIAEGEADGVDLAGLGIVMAIRYSDDEPGSPWSYFLYIDDRAGERQRQALVDLFTGKLSGTSHDHFPWVWKASHLLGCRAVPMEIEHTPHKSWFRAGEHVTLRIREPVADQAPVTCVIPGHQRDGEEQIADLLRVDDGPLVFEVSGRCAYQSTFAYSG